MVKLNLDAKPPNGEDELEQALAALRARGLQPHRSGHGWISKCPTHDDHRQSLSLGVGDNGGLMLRCHANSGCSFPVILSALGIDAKGSGSTGPRPAANTAQNSAGRGAGASETKKRNTVAKPQDALPRGHTLDEAYAYTDKHGETLFLILRCKPKTFRVRVPAPEGRWYTDKTGVPIVLYELPAVLSEAKAGGVVYVVEGERAAERVKQEGVVATTKPFGANNHWTPELAEALRGAHVIIIADADDVGRESARELAALLPGVAESIQLLESATGVAKHGADDHLDAGLGFADLIPMRVELDALPPDPTETPPGLDDEHEDASHSWIPLDLVRIGDTPRVPPELGALIYKGRRHLVSGESESGKSWLCFAIAADELKAGRGVVWVDLDYMGAQDILERLRQLGVTDALIRDCFAFYQPEGALKGDALDDVLALISRRNARLVVIDAFTGFCALHGLKPNDGIDIEQAYRAMQPLCDTGAAVVIIDHVVKNTESRGRYASGSERKLSGADIALGFTLIEPFGRGKIGRSKITVHKDRPAQLTRPVAGVFVLRSEPDTHMVSWSLEEDRSTGDDGTWRPTGFMESISRHLEQFGTADTTRSSVENAVTGKSDHLRKAMDRLRDEGFTSETPGARRAIHIESIKPYREDSD